jgi:hypothetical protein
MFPLPFLVNAGKAAILSATANRILPARLLKQWNAGSTADGRREAQTQMERTLTGEQA